jgi:hypothetical protein
MGNNISTTSGGGNITFNLETNEIDLNILLHGDFSNFEKLSHELKHAFQYLEEKIMFSVKLVKDDEGNVKGIVAPIVNTAQNEREAYNRQNEFAGRYPMSTELIERNVTSQSRVVGDHRSEKNKKEFDINRENYKTANRAYMQKYGFPKVVYSGWKQDL